MAVDEDEVGLQQRLGRRGLEQSVNDLFFFCFRLPSPPLPKVKHPFPTWGVKVRDASKKDDVGAHIL
jgi:hypothetical protein